MELCSIKSSANNEGEISRGLGESLKNDCIPLLFPSFSFFCSVAMFQIRARSFFRKCVVLMHFKSPFSKHNRISQRRSLVVPLKKVAQSLRAVLHCARA